VSKPFPEDVIIWQGEYIQKNHHRKINNQKLNDTGNACIYTLYKVAASESTAEEEKILVLLNYYKSATQRYALLLKIF